MPHKLYNRDEVVEIINSALGQAKTAEYAALAGVLSALQESIVSFLGQLRDARPGEISRTHIPTAQDELDAVVGATEQATVDIMDACEKILLAGKAAPRSIGKDIEAHALRIFEACAFQDITGQRIRKATTALRQIDAKIITLLAALGGDGAPDTVPVSSAPPNLLNGPALPQNAMTQADIDKLLAEFDNNA